MECNNGLKMANNNINRKMCSKSTFEDNTTDGTVPLNGTQVSNNISIWICMNLLFAVFKPFLLPCPGTQLKLIYHDQRRKQKCIVAMVTLHFKRALIRELWNVTKVPKSAGTVTSNTNCCPFSSWPEAKHLLFTNLLTSKPLWNSSVHLQVISSVISSEFDTSAESCFQVEKKRLATCTA